MCSACGLTACGRERSFSKKNDGSAANANTEQVTTMTQGTKCSAVMPRASADVTTTSDKPSVSMPPQ
ncbi:hypothetical protein D3C73_1150750 [compost metagenome]